MTQEEKAKRYDDALEKAKSMIDDLRKGEDILGGWTTTASTFGSDYDIDTDKIKQNETSKSKS